MMRRISKNSIKCKHCGDILVSKSRHDYKMCSCGKCGVDGGLDYLRRSFITSPEDDFEELSEYQND